MSGCPAARRTCRSNVSAPSCCADGRWRSLRHRVLAPPASAPKEELVSLVFFFEADPDALITPLSAPVGGGEGMKPVIAGEEILEKVGLTLSLDG